MKKTQLRTLANREVALVSQPYAEKSPRKRPRVAAVTKSQMLLRTMFVTLPRRALKVSFPKSLKTPTDKLAAPVALFYNMANGFRNLPSYAIRNDPGRRRDEITGFGSGCKLAGKVCFL